MKLLVIPTDEGYIQFEFCKKCVDQTEVVVTLFVIIIFKKITMRLVVISKTEFF